MTPEQQRAVALARAKAKARARGAGKTYTQFQSFNEGIGEGVYLSARDEAEGGAAVRRRLGGGGLDQFAKSIPFGEIPLAVLDAAGGFVQDLAPGLYGGGVQKVYEGARDERRTIQKVAAADNPLSYGGGQILGSAVTLAPVGGAGARSSAMVADDLLREGVKLTGKAAVAKSAPRAAALTAKATAKTARAAQLAKPAATIGEFTARASRIAGESAAKGAGYGAGIGGGLGFTAGEGDIGDRLATASDAAVVGGIAGGVLGPVIQGLAPLIGGIAYKITTPKEIKGLDMVIKRMQRSGTTPEGIKAQFDLWNKTGEVPETLAEFMGPNERSLLSALITVNRETREQATNIFVNRGREEVNRLEDAFAGSFGAKRGDYAAAQTQAAKARVEDPEPFYKAAHFDKDGSLKPLGPEKMSALNNILADEDDIVRIAKDATADLNRMGNRSPAHKAARDEVRMYAEALQAARRGERVQVPQLSVLAADYIERAINQSYKAAGGGSGEISGSIAGWKALRNSVRDVIDDTGIGEARATSAERIRRGELLEEGLGIMKTSVDVDDVNRIMTGIPDAGIPAASEAGRRAYGVGASRAVANELRNVPDMAGFADATRKVARTPALREKLEAARPKVLTKSGAENKGSKQTKANAALDQAIERASDRAQFGVDMVGNSRTAFRQGDVTDAIMDDAMSQQAGEVIGDLLISGVGGVTQRLQDRAGRFIGNRIGQPSIYRPQINREVANILLATGEQIPIQIARIAKRAAERANGRGRAPLVPPAGGIPPATPPAGGSASGRTVGKGKLGTRTADAAAIAAVATGGPTAQADTGGATTEADTVKLTPEMVTANERVALAEQIVADTRSDIEKLESQLEMLQDPAGDPAEKQRILKLRGHDLGKYGPKKDGIDGVIDSKTIAAINGEAAKIEAAIARKQADLEKAQVEEAAGRKDVTREQMRQSLADAEKGIGSPIFKTAADLTSGAAFLGGIYLAGRARGGAVKEYAKSARTAATNANRLLNSGRYRADATVGPNSANVRAANLNEFWKQGGAGRKVPFTSDDLGQLSARKGAKEPSQLFKAPRYLDNDKKFIIATAIESQATKAAADHFGKEAEEAQKEMDAAYAANDRVAYDAAVKARNLAAGGETFFRVLERLGYGLAAGRTLSGLKKYPAVNANIKAAEAERNLILQGLQKQKTVGAKP
jgi:hypothetical protein